MEALEKIAEQLERIADHITASPPPKKTVKRKEPDHNPTYTDDFLEFWKTYPRKKAKADAFKAWTQTLESHPPDMMRRVKRFSASWMQRDRSELTYCPYPASWLRGHGWEDDVTFNSKVKPMGSGHEVGIQRVVQQESGQFYADPDWREYKRLVSAGTIEPGFLKWKEGR